MYKVDFYDELLFGNDAGEDEDIEQINGYFVEKGIFRKFRSDNMKLAIVRARKGMGKSILLKKIADEKEKEGNIVIRIDSSDLFSIIPGNPSLVNREEYIVDWERRLSTAIICNIGKRINMAMDDLTMAIVETAELEGFRDRNLLSAITDRFKMKIKLGNIELEKMKEKLVNNTEALKRFGTKKEDCIWLFIDNIDDTFINTPEERLKLATYFRACRKLCHDVKGLKIRTTIRADVWPIIYDDQLMDKTDQYTIDLEWSMREISTIVLFRIRNYLRISMCPLSEDEINSLSQKELFNYVFKYNYKWAGSKKEPWVVFNTLSNKRPRWTMKLLRSAAIDAANFGFDYIKEINFKNILPKYGRKRLLDIVSEHKHECEKVEDLLLAFTRENSRMTTTELLTVIDKKIIKRLGQELHISGIIGTPTDIDVARFLFQINFLTARDESKNGNYIHYSIIEKRHLLDSKSDEDNIYIWEIPPFLRDVLHLTKSSELE